MTRVRQNVMASVFQSLIGMFTAFRSAVRAPSALATTFSKSVLGGSAPPMPKPRGESIVPLMTAAMPKSRQTFLSTQRHKLSAPLKAVCGKGVLSRTQVTKQVWSYIKRNRLQKPSDKRIVQCDPTLKKVFGRKEIQMLKIGKGVQKHILQPISKSAKKA